MPFSKQYISLPFDESEFRERNRDLALLLDLSGLMASTHDLGPLLSEATRKVAEHFHLAAARLYVMDKGGEFMLLAARHGIEAQGLEKVRLDEGFSGKAVRTRSFIAQRVGELDDRKRIELLAAKGIKIVICVPLMIREEVLGVMNLASRVDLNLNFGTVDLLNAIGSQIAVAVSNIGLFEEIKARMSELEKKKETIKFFAYTASHDLKGPAVAIHGLLLRLQKLLGDSLDEKTRACLDHIYKASDQLEDLVEDLNAYVSAKEAPIAFETFEVQELLSEIEQEFDEAVKRRSIRWRHPDRLPSVSAHRLSMARVFRNLVDNALKYGGEDLSEIQFGYRDEGNHHLFSVADDGVGISAEDGEHIFELFQRRSTSQGTEGSGIGLAIAKEIVQRHGGRIRLEKGARSGSTFSFSIQKALTPSELPPGNGD